MSLAHDSFAFFSHPHGSISIVTPPELRLHIGSFFGVIGESHIVGEAGGADLACEFDFQGYSTLPLLQADLDTLNSKSSLLTGTLTETIEGNDRTFPQTTFVEFNSTNRPFKDGVSSQWALFGQLLWRWRKPVTV